MKNLLPRKVEIYKKYATSVFAKFRQARFGLGKAIADDYALMAQIQKSVVDWQVKDDAGALSDPNIQYRTWFPTRLYDTKFLFATSGSGFAYGNPNSPDNDLDVLLPHATGEQNIIQVNANGAITRINLNPSITINQNSSFVYTQDQPSTLWVINHNMGRVPVVFAEDTAGNDINGIIEVIDSNNLRVLFNPAVAGKAYLS